MNKEHDFYYYILGLQAGASAAEIKSAFRRLVKLYHADHDKSLDAEVKYREIQMAYKMLLKQISTSDTSAESNSSEHTTWSYDIPPSWQDENKQKSDSPEQAAHIPYEWAPEYYHVNVKFEWNMLPAYMLSSLNETLRDVLFDAAGAAFIIKGFGASFFAFLSCGGNLRRFDSTPMPPYAEFAMWFFITSWILYTLLRVFFRYFFVPQAWGLSTKIYAGIIYGAMLVFLIACFYTVPITELISIGFWATISILILIANL